MTLASTSSTLGPRADPPRIWSGLALATPDGEVVESYEYEPYGLPTIYDDGGEVVASRTSTVGTRFMFTGREWDEVGEFYHYRHRTYSPFEKRFMQRDPIGLAGEWNVYAYCGGDPVNASDPMGLRTLRQDDNLPQNPRDADYRFRLPTEFGPRVGATRVWIIYNNGWDEIERDRALIANSYDKSRCGRRILVAKDETQLLELLNLLHDSETIIDQLFIIPSHGSRGAIANHEVSGPKDLSGYLDGSSHLVRPGSLTGAGAFGRKTTVVFMGCDFFRQDIRTSANDMRVAGEQWSTFFRSARIVGTIGSTQKVDPVMSTGEWMMYE